MGSDESSPPYFPSLADFATPSPPNSVPLNLFASSPEVPPLPSRLKAPSPRKEFSRTHVAANQRGAASSFAQAARRQPQQIRAPAASSSAFAFQRSPISDTSMAGTPHDASMGHHSVTSRKRFLLEDSALIPCTLDMTSPDSQASKRRSTTSTLNSTLRHLTVHAAVSSQARTPPSRNMSLLSSFSSDNSVVEHEKITEARMSLLSLPEHGNEERQVVSPLSSSSGADTASFGVPEKRRESRIERSGSTNWSTQRGAMHCSPRPSRSSGRRNTQKSSKISMRSPLLSAGRASPSSAFQTPPQRKTPPNPDFLSSESELELETMELDDMMAERDWYHQRLLGVEAAASFAQRWCDTNPGNAEFEAFVEAVKAQLYAQ
eukprot:GEMP01026172.1.p1 GENE.GEMP01026172.1~~GEMP01026172.1.p1  ORF type:complete len:384 (+),score=92.90 GEMP01026172.1:26-1153(+)